MQRGWGSEAGRWVAGAALACGLAGTAMAQGADGWRHAMALSGEPGYAAGFERFDYVNPDAPQGGEVKLSWPRGFDSLNPILPKGLPAPGITLLYESLMTPSLDEEDISASYGLIAEAARYPDDLSSVTFRLNPNARWHDGEPIDAEDVIWSFERAVELSPQRKFYYRNVTGAEETAPGEVTFTFDQTGNRELPYIMGQVLVLPKHWWGEERDGEPRIEQDAAGRVPARLRSLPASPPSTRARPSPTSGCATAGPRGTRRGWASGTSIPSPTRCSSSRPYPSRRSRRTSMTGRASTAPRNGRPPMRASAPLADGDVIREEFPETTTGRMQAFVPNLRLPKFQDARVRRALNLAFDFETTKRTVFYDQYERNDSFFDRTDLASSGLPEGRELEILREVAAEHPDGVPEAVFTEPYANPSVNDPGDLRDNLREADRLLREAGWNVVDGRRMKDGEVLRIEYVEDSPLFEAIALPWLRNLERLGIEADYRFVDQAQAIERERNRDFDLMTKTWVQTLSPGNEQREYWGSEAADNPASQNVGGIKNPAVDALIDRIVFSADRDDLVAATRALDRVLLHSDYVIPQWVSDTTRTLRWDKFGRPDDLTERLRGFSTGFPAVWWYDEAKAAEVDAR